ncbi:uncharacterized protein FOBCDRAFT_238443 [Fusarium oxysporum Fo47]|uniref:uncharacterized protein n=1 Tax=Fusarium oxysporum Fo47 TaxID=660027 RepID=UPI002869E43B|nr:uncharacterized protein FOBCDRAFT_238443 [Fusarium oxysporum Fo47]QKD52115.2 hypothetical protein FOBCDRAFT_238443 [Fusarium oxysporum Fo47]
MLPSSLFSTYQQYKEDTDSTKGRGRLKGKARRDAKEQKTYIPTPHTIQKYVIAVKDFIPLAKFMLASNHSSQFGAQLIDHGMKPSTKSDATHYVFVGILEKARDVLRPRMPAGTKSFSSFEDLGNRFSGLKIYEPSPELLDFTDIERPKNAQGDDTIYEAEPKTSLEDALSNYRDGYFDLANAAVSTNTGINLARNLTDQILPIIKDHGSACTILEKFSFVCARRDGLSEDDIVAWGPAVENEDIMSDRSSRKGPAKFKEDQIFLSEFFTEAVTLARLAPNYPVEDEFIRGIRELDMNGNIPFHLVYASQFLSDVHHIIRDHISSALDSLLKHTTTMDSELSSHIDFHGNLKIENWPASNEGALCEFNQSLQWFAQDLGVGSLAMKSERDRILVHSPILCGLMLYHFRAKMCTFGIAITNAWGSITYSAHLHSYLNHFLLQIGYSASAFAAGGDRLLQRPGRHHDLASRAGPCGIKDGAPIDLSPQHVEQITSRSRFQEKGSEKNSILMLTLIDDRDELRKKRQPKQCKKMTGVQWPPGELLRSLVLALGWCWKFLRHVKEACDFTLKQLELPFATSYIFMAASDEQEGKEDFLMLAAAKVFNVMIEGGAGELVLGVFATEDDSDASGSADEAET